MCHEKSYAVPNLRNYRILHCSYLNHATRPLISIENTFETHQTKKSKNITDMVTGTH